MQVVSRQDGGVDLGQPPTDPVWTGVGQAAAWQLGALGSSLAALQTVTASRCAALHRLVPRSLSKSFAGDRHSKAGMHLVAVQTLAVQANLHSLSACERPLKQQDCLLQAGGILGGRGVASAAAALAGSVACCQMDWHLGWQGCKPRGRSCIGAAVAAHM